MSERYWKSKIDVLIIRRIRRYKETPGSDEEVHEVNPKTLGILETGAKITRREFKTTEWRPTSEFKVKIPVSSALNPTAFRIPPVGISRWPLQRSFPRIFDDAAAFESAIYSARRNFVKINAGAWQAQGAYRFSRGRYVSNVRVKQALPECDK